MGWIAFFKNGKKNANVYDTPENNFDSNFNLNLTRLTTIRYDDEPFINTKQSYYQQIIDKLSDCVPEPIPEPTPEPTIIDIATIIKSICNSGNDIINEWISWFSDGYKKTNKQIPLIPNTDQVNNNFHEQIKNLNKLDDATKIEKQNQIIEGIQKCITPNIDELGKFICEQNNAIIQECIEYFSTPSNLNNPAVQIPSIFTDTSDIIKTNMDILKNHTDINNYCKNLIELLKKCLKPEPESESESESESEPEPEPESEPEPEPVKFNSADLITYITPQDIVYIYDKVANVINEYEGGEFENRKLRPVKLSDDGKILVNFNGNFVELSFNNFPELYPSTNKTIQTKEFYDYMVKSSKAVLNDISNS